MTTKLLTYLLEGGGAIAAARGLWFAWTWYVQYRDARAANAAIVGRGEIGEALRELRYSTPADYVHVIRIHNGGGNLRAGLTMYMTCLYEDHDTDRPPRKAAVQGIEIDDNYRSMVEQLLQVKDGSAAVADVKDHLLHDIYRSQGAKFTRSVLLATRRDGIYFLRATSSTAPLGGAVGENQNIHFRRAVSVLKKHY